MKKSFTKVPAGGTVEAKRTTGSRSEESGSCVKISLGFFSFAGGSKGCNRVNFIIVFASRINHGQIVLVYFGKFAILPVFVSGSLC